MEDTRANLTALAQGKAFEWHELNTPDIDAAIEFYTSNLGFGTTEMSMGEMGSYKMLTRNDHPVCGVTNGPPGGQTGWVTYLSVDDVDARVESCQASGGVLVGGPMDVPTVGRMAMIQDPQGARIWLFKGVPA